MVLVTAVSAWGWFVSASHNHGLGSSHVFGPWIIAQVLAHHQADSHAVSAAADVPLLSPMTAAEAAERRLPMPKNMVQAVCVTPRLSGTSANATSAVDRAAAALRMVVTVPSRFCGVSVNHAGLSRRGVRNTGADSFESVRRCHDRLTLVCRWGCTS